jgi:hypothetical protein
MECAELSLALGSRGRSQVVVTGTKVNVGHVQEPGHQRTKSPSVVRAVLLSRPA